jgi:hypothetical protein
MELFQVLPGLSPKWLGDHTALPLTSAKCHFVLSGISCALKVGLVLVPVRDSPGLPIQEQQAISSSDVLASELRASTVVPVSSRVHASGTFKYSPKKRKRV